MKHTFIAKVVVFSAVLLLLTACGLRNTYKDADNRIERTHQEIATKEAAQDQIAPPVVIKDGYYVDDHPVSFAGPSWLHQPINLQAQNMPLDQMVTRLLQGTQINPRYDETVQSERLVSMHYRGTIQGALDTLAAQTRYFYTIDGHSLSWSSFQTRTFNISFMPGASKYLVGQSATSSSRASSDNGTSGTINSDVNDDQYSSLEANLSVWNDLRNGLDQLKSADGQVVISEATTTVTVHDHPDNVQAMAEYIAKLNTELSQQVAIKVEILDIELDKQYNLGIDWDVVAHALDLDFNLKSNLATASNIATNSLLETGSDAINQFTISSNQHSTLIQALDQQGKVHVVTRPQVVTMNNQIASIRITTDTGYIQSVSTTVQQEVSSTSITPGTVTDGFTLYILPKIQGDDVYMQISSTISNLVRLVKESNEPTSDSGKNQNNPNAVAVQLPTLSQKIFNQRSVVGSGTTLVVAGYKRLRDETNSAKLFGVAALGGEGATAQNVETLILITPIILKRPSEINR